MGGVRQFQFYYNSRVSRSFAVGSWSSWVQGPWNASLGVRCSKRYACGMWYSMYPTKPACSTSWWVDDEDRGHTTRCRSATAKTRHGAAIRSTSRCNQRARVGIVELEWVREIGAHGEARFDPSDGKRRRNVVGTRCSVSAETCIRLSGSRFTGLGCHDAHAHMPYLL